MRELRHKIFIQLGTIYLRYAIGGTFVFASLIKIKGKRFTSVSGADVPIDSAFHLFETLYQSGIYWQFIGFAQLITGGLLMTQKYAKLGSVLYLPIILNIFVITISYDFHFTPVVTGGLVLANIWLLFWHWNELKILINKPTELLDIPQLEDDKLWMKVGLIMFLFTFLYRLIVDQYNIILWLGICFIIGLAGTIIYKIKSVKEPHLSLDNSQTFDEENKLERIQKSPNNRINEINYSGMERFLVKKGNRFFTLLSNEISHFFMDKVLYLVTMDGQKFMYESTLDDLENQLNNLTFFRVNRQCIINYSSIESIVPESSNRFKIKLKPPVNTEFNVSQGKSSQFKDWISR